MGRLIIGIDPGLRHGGVVALTEAGEIYSVAEIGPMNSAVDMATALRRLNDFGAGCLEVVLEDVGAIGFKPEWGHKALFGLGRAVGHVEALLAFLEWPWIYVRPKEWQRTMLRKVDGATPKSRAKAAFRRQWPMADASHDGIVDAALIAEWRRRQRAVLAEAEEVAP